MSNENLDPDFEEIAVSNNSTITASFPDDSKLITQIIDVIEFEHSVKNPLFEECDLFDKAITTKKQKQSELSKREKTDSDYAEEDDLLVSSSLKIAPKSDEQFNRSSLENSLIDYDDLEDENLSSSSKCS
jgi:hypothetical protein